MREALFAARPGAVNLCDYGPEGRTTSPLVKQIRYGPGGSVSRLGRALAEIEALTLAGHLRSQDYGEDFGPAQLITVLRHPVDQVVSHYTHFRSRGWFAGGLAEFASEPRFKNLQTRLAGGTARDRWWFVARQETLETDVRRLSQLMGVELRLERLNIAIGPTPALDGSMRALIQDMNRRDMDLYESLGLTDRQIG